MEGIRQKFRWTVHLTTQNGQKVNEEVTSFWDPKRDDTPACVAVAARLQANKKHNDVFVPVGDPVLVS